MSSRDTEVVKRFIGAINQGDYDLIGTIIAPGMIAWGSDWRGPVPTDLGPERSKRGVGGMRAGFPDLHIEVDDMVAADGKVACRLTLSGTHRGSYLGVEATGRRVSWQAVFIYRVVGDHIVEMWSISDSAGLARQLGADL
jgi:hypothetical protein